MKDGSEDDGSDDKEDGRKDGSEDDDSDDDPPPLQDCNEPVRWPHGSKGTDSIAAGNANEVGRHVVLPSSHGGGPRDMKQRFADASAVVRKFGKPEDLFLTFTCNPTCGDDSECSKRFPRDFASVTCDSADSYPVYRRRSPADGGQEVVVRGTTIDNRRVVPYNPYLLRKFAGHMNIEICTSITSVKYLYKYVYKGHDSIFRQVPPVVPRFRARQIVSKEGALWKVNSKI